MYNWRLLKEFRFEIVNSYSRKSHCTIVPFLYVSVQVLLLAESYGGKVRESYLVDSRNVFVVIARLIVRN